MLALIVDPFSRDHMCLQRALRSLRCEVASAYSRAQGHAVLLTRRPALIVCERDLADGNWQDFLRPPSGSESPLLIVTSRLADERLWSEVLNLGGYDVLAKPFEETEVGRVLEAALRHLGFRQQPGKREVHATGC